LTDTKIHLPMDVIVSPDETGEIYIKETGPGKVRKEEEIFDIGPETIQTFSSIIKEAKTIIWSGPLGLIENKLFKKGTETIAQRIVANTSAFSIAGGGDTIKILRELNFIDKFSFISTGGSAMLSFLAEEKLPGIEALKV
ncbi:phosphoglycerate kinase, partial [bacterium (Candidatus Gribaldobacteria) CG_4_9_14_3_um_filter_33_9]